MRRNEIEADVFDEITSHYMTNECQLWITSYEPSSGGPERRVTLRAYEPMLVSGRLADHVTIDFFSIGDLSDFSKLLAWAVSSPVDGRHFFNIRDPEAQDPRTRFIGEDDALEVIASHVEPGLRYGDRFDAFLQLRHADEGKAALEKWLASGDDSELAKFVDKFIGMANEAEKSIDTLINEDEAEAYEVVSIPESLHERVDALREKALRNAPEFSDATIDKMQSVMASHGFVVPVRVISNAFRAAMLFARTDEE